MTYFKYSQNNDNVKLKINLKSKNTFIFGADILGSKSCRACMIIYVEI